MRWCKRSTVALIGFLVAVAATAAAVRAHRRAASVATSTGAWSDLDLVLADRIRSELGSLEHALDIPHVHVMVERHVAVLHGDVPSAVVAREVVERVRQVAGVRDVVSHLHVGLLASDTRPSDGVEPSAAARRLVAAALRAGAGEVTSDLAVRAVLGTFASVLPGQTRRHLFSHLPADAATLLALPVGARVTGPIRTVEDLYAAVVAMDVLPPTHVPWVVDAVVGALRSLVPDEVADVASALPPELRHLWADAAAERDAG